MWPAFVCMGLALAAGITFGTHRFHLRWHVARSLKHVTCENDSVSISLRKKKNRLWGGKLTRVRPGHLHW